jgi:hypothetical protein
MEVSTLNTQSAALHQGFRDFSMGSIEGSAEGGAGYLHPQGGVLLVEAFLVSQAQSFQLLNAELDLLQFREWNTPWFEVDHSREFINAFATRGTWQGRPRLIQ